MKHLYYHLPKTALTTFLTALTIALTACTGGQTTPAPTARDTLRALIDSTTACKERADYVLGVMYADTALALVGEADSALLAEVLCNRGYMCCKLGRIDEAVSDELRAVAAARAAGDNLQLSRAYLYLADANLVMPQYDEARLFVEQALKADALLPPTPQRHNTYGMACEVYFSQRDSVTRRFTHLDEAERYGLLAVSEARRLGDSIAVANHLSQLSYAVDLRGFQDPAHGEPYFCRALRLIDHALALLDTDPVTDPTTLAYALEYRTFYLMDLGRYSEALPVLRRAMQMQQQLGGVRSLANDYRTLATLLMKTGQTDEAEAALQRHNHLFDSIRTARTDQRIAEADATLHVDLLQHSMDSHRLRYRWLLGVVVLLLLAVLVAYYWHLRRRNAHIRRLVAELEALRTPSLATDYPSPDTHHPSPALSEADAQFLRDVRAAVCRLMPHGHCDVAAVAAEFCMSSSKFSRDIKRITGSTAAQYLLALRMDEAKRLLAQRPAPTLAAVAEACGFVDHSHFTRTYRRLYGTLPSQATVGAEV